MAIVRDWAIEAAKEIADGMADVVDTRKYIDGIQSIIRRHCPFKPDTIYVELGEHRAALALLAESRREHSHCDDSWYCCRKCDCADHGELPTQRIGSTIREAGTCD